jgi:hypothetical protein
MATNDTRQAAIDRYGRGTYQRGDLIDRSTGKVKLTECPLCLVDPSRPRHPFGEQANRAVHFADEHDGSAVTSARR